MAGITTPFTTPTFPFLQTVSQRALDNISPGLRAAERAERRADPADADRGPRPGRVRRRRHAGLRLRAAVERLGAAGADDRTRPSRRPTSARTSRTSASPIPTSISSPSSSSRWGRALNQRVPNPYFGIIPRSSSLGNPTIPRGAASQAVSRLHDRQPVSQQRRHHALSGLRAESAAAARARLVVLDRATRGPG